MYLANAAEHLAWQQRVGKEFQAEANYAGKFQGADYFRYPDLVNYLLKDDQQKKQLQAERNNGLKKKNHSFKDNNASLGMHGTFGTSHYSYAKKNPLLFRPKSSGKAYSQKELKTTSTLYHKAADAKPTSCVRQASTVIENNTERGAAMERSLPQKKSIFRKKDVRTSFTQQSGNISGGAGFDCTARDVYGRRKRQRFNEEFDTESVRSISQQSVSQKNINQRTLGKMSGDFTGGTRYGTVTPSDNGSLQSSATLSMISRKKVTTGSENVAAYQIRKRHWLTRERELACRRAKIMAVVDKLNDDELGKIDCMLNGDMPEMLIDQLSQNQDSYVEQVIDNNQDFVEEELDEKINQDSVEEILIEQGVAINPAAVMLKGAFVQQPPMSPSQASRTSNAGSQKAVSLLTNQIENEKKMRQALQDELTNLKQTQQKVVAKLSETKK